MVGKQIGVYEIFKDDLSKSLDEDGDVDITELDGPLLYSFVNKEYLEVFSTMNNDEDYGDEAEADGDVEADGEVEADGDVVSWVETKSRDVTKGANHLSIVCGSKRVAAVFYQPKVIFFA